jgi:myosin-5
MLQTLVSSLEKKIDDTEKKYQETSKVSEERLKQAMDAETKIGDLNMAMLRSSYFPSNWTIANCYFSHI